jgi:outer membrane immunogenic protein
MRRIALALLASTSLLGLASVAEAADLAVRKAPPPPPPPPIWSWTGFYIGAHVGAGWSRKEFTTHDPVCLGGLVDTDFDGFGCENSKRGSHNAIGGLGGAQVGFNWQTGIIVFGIEAQYSWARLKGDHADSTHLALGELDNSFQASEIFLINAQSRFSTEIDGIATIAGRLGIVSGPQDRTMFYVKGGAAYVKEDFKERINGSFLFAEVSEGSLEALPVNVTGDFTGSRSKWGWMFGAGVEWGLWDNWSAKIEYNYLDFGDKNVKLAGQACFEAFVEHGEEPVKSECKPFDRTHKIDQNIQVIKFGLNYRFGPWGKAPAVMAKY